MEPLFLDWPMIFGTLAFLFGSGILIHFVLLGIEKLMKRKSDD